MGWHLCRLPVFFSILGAHLAVLVIPAAYLLVRARGSGDRNVPCC
jgi:hypothetical protein